MSLVHCTACGATNRVEGASDKKVPHCGRCGARLAGKVSGQVVFWGKHKYWLILGAIVAAGYFGNEVRQAAPYNVRNEQTVARLVLQPQPTTITPTVSQPARAPVKDFGDIDMSQYRQAGEIQAPAPFTQGVVARSTTEQAVAPLRITTPAGRDNYFVKVVDVVTGVPVATMLIAGGQTFDTKVPLGTYRIRYATGETWFGEAALFGPDTGYSEADKTFEFTEHDGSVDGYTIELIRRQGGNLESRKLSAGQF